MGFFYKNEPPYYVLQHWPWANDHLVKVRQRENEPRNG